MSEPHARASKLEAVVPGIYRFWVKDDRIGGKDSEAYAVEDGGKLTLVDPLPVDLAALEAVAPVEAIVLTAGNHQRSAWRLRDALKVPVFAPRSAYGLEQAPDSEYEGGDALPGGLVAYHTPGPVESMHALWAVKPVRVAFLSDLLVHEGEGRLAFVPGKYQDEPARTRASVRRVMESLGPDVLLFAHGPPLTQNVRAALERVLREDPEHLSVESGPQSGLV